MPTNIDGKVIEWTDKTSISMSIREPPIDSLVWQQAGNVASEATMVLSGCGVVWSLSLQVDGNEPLNQFHVTSSPSLAVFKRQLKTVGLLFTRSYPTAVPH